MTDKSLYLVRLAKEHLPALADIEQASFAEPWSEAALAILLAENNFGIVAMRGDTAVAYGGMTCILDEGNITNVATRPEHRGQGIGHAVVRALLDEARQRGISSVFLEVRPSNAPALALYRAEGFAECGRRKNFYRYPAEDAILMVWREESKER